MIEFEFRNGWKKDDRKWYGIQLFPLVFSIFWRVGMLTIWIAFLGFELYLHFRKKKV